MQELHAAPFPLSNGYGPCGILAVCHINLWSAVRTELGQKDWVKQLVAKARGPIVASDQGSGRGHHCSQMTLTGYPSSKVWVAPLGHEPLPPVGGKQTVSPLDQ
jgi:hypothetical protein